jgi:uncharacterized membrane protein
MPSSTSASYSKRNWKRRISGVSKIATSFDGLFDILLFNMMAKGKPVQVQYHTLVVIWIALLTSQVLFLALVWFVRPEILTNGAERTARDGFLTTFLHDMPVVTFVFAAIAVVFLLLSFVLSRQHMRRAKRDKDAGCVQTGLILGCALSEVPSLLGVVLAFAFDHPYFYLWIALGLFGILLHFPRKGNLDAATFRQK